MPLIDSLPEEVRLYLQKADIKLNGAELLLSKRFNDDVASRAYYAVFYAIVAALRFKNVDIAVHKHAYLINQFKKLQPSPLPTKLLNKIDTIKNNREIADYSIRCEFTLQDAENILRDAREIITKIREYLENA